MCDSGGAVARVMGILRDVTEAKGREDELRESARRNMFSDVGNALTPETCSTGSQIEGCEDLRETPSGLGPLDQMLTTIERREILSALKRAKGQRTLAARLLGISRSRLYRRMEALGIDPREIRSA